MNQELEAKFSEQSWKDASIVNATMVRATASASMVNRTHRIIRERATNMQAQKSKFRGLLLPLVVSAGLLLAVVCAAWVMLDEYDVTPVGLPEPGQQLFVFMLWCLPISVVALAVVAFRLSGSKADSGGRR